MIKMFEQFNNEQIIHDLCREYVIENYTINEDGTLDVDGSVLISNNPHLKQLPLRFNKVSGFFNCSFNKLTSLKGSPKEVGTFFTCYDNKLNDLKYAPNRIGSWFDCSNNNLKNLVDSPTSKNLFFCEGNPLESLEGYNGDYDKLECEYKEKLIRKTKLRILNIL